MRDVYKITHAGFELFDLAGVSIEILEKMKPIVDREYVGVEGFQKTLEALIGKHAFGRHRKLFLRFAYQKTVSEDDFEKISAARNKYYSCFISYSRQDSEFADKLCHDLKSKDIECWLDREKMRGGREIRPAVIDAVASQDKMVVIISKDSIQSDWVKSEINWAEQKKHQTGENVLLPIQIDDVLAKVEKTFVKDLFLSIHTEDFTNWRIPGEYKQALDKLLASLEKTFRN